MTTLGDQHRRVSELLGAYVLHAVDADEAVLVEQHLDTCPRCQSEVDDLREVAAAVGNSSVPPPGDLWDRIAQAVDRAGAGPADAVVPFPSSARVPGAPGVARGKARRPVGRGPRSRRAATVAVVALAAACAALAVVFGVNWSNANGRADQLQTALARQGASAAVTAALRSPGHRVVELHSPAGAQLAEVVVRRGGAGYVVSSRMAALPTRETYQLWAEIDGKPISLGLLGPKPGLGDAFSLGGSVRSASSLMVTVEPSGGVVTPSAAPVATAALS